MNAEVLEKEEQFTSIGKLAVKVGDDAKTSIKNAFDLMIKERISMARQ